MERPIISNNEVREDDLWEGRRVYVEWGPYDSKDPVVGTIVGVKRWPRSDPRQGEAPYEIVIRIKDEVTGNFREASYREQWIDILAPKVYLSE